MRLSESNALSMRNESARYITSIEAVTARIGEGQQQQQHQELLNKIIRHCSVCSVGFIRLAVFISFLLRRHNTID